MEANQMSSYGSRSYRFTLHYAEKHCAMAEQRIAMLQEHNDQLLAENLFLQKRIAHLENDFAVSEFKLFEIQANFSQLNGEYLKCCNELEAMKSVRTANSGNANKAVAVESPDDCPPVSTEPANRSAEKSDGIRSAARFLCRRPGCDKSFGRNSIRKQHEATQHEAAHVKNDGAGQTSADRSSKRVNRNVAKRKYVCDFEGCGRGFLNAGHLTQHKFIHSDVKRFKCEQCSQEFTYKSNMNQHIKRTHMQK